MRKILSTLFAALVLVSCQKEECLDCRFDPVVPTKVSRVYFHYMAMHNNLSFYADQNINEMFQGANKESLNGGVIYVFRDVPGTNSKSQLISIFWDEENKKTQKIVVKTYEANLDASSPETLKRVIRDVDALVDAPSWVLGFGSHGMGWMPASMYPTYGTAPLLRSFVGEPATRFLVDDNGTRMECDDFVAALTEVMPQQDMPTPQGDATKKYDFILVDMCFMGGVEFAYALRDAANYLILSPAEIVAKGMPYNTIVDDIFADDVRQGAQGICQEFYDLYDNYHMTDRQFGTISLVDCKEFEPFVSVMRQVTTNFGVQTIDLNTLLCYDRFYKPISFDVGEFAQALGGRSAAFDEALSALVPFRRSTGKSLLGALTIPAERYSGLSTYIPVSEYADLNEFYYKTAWWRVIAPSALGE